MNRNGIHKFRPYLTYTIFFYYVQVVHMTMNPADEAADNYKNEMDKLRAEVNSKHNDSSSVYLYFTKFYYL